jgi:crotonobetainyl-CoA:carnitine CoA-transferase CaiB-like acyl-CoA transferase
VAFPALAGLRVVDATEGIAGGYATKLLADLGADVTKVERAGGDPLRWWSAASPDEPLLDTGALFAFLNEGKTTIAADDTGGVEELVRDADVILTGEGVDVVRSAAYSATTSVVTIRAFGAVGPLAGMPADEFTLQAWCGLMSGCGTRETPPLQMGIGHGQWATGAMAALAALAACEHRARFGTGAAMEVSALEVMSVCLMNYPTLYRHFTGSVSVMSRGGDWPQIVRCKDGWIGLCIFTPQQWDDFANMIGRPDLTGDDRLNSMGGRGRNREFAQSVIRPWLEDHTAAEIFELGGLFRVPVAYVGNGRDVLTMEQFRERGVFVENAAGFLQPRSPFLSHAVPTRTGVVQGRRATSNGAGSLGEGPRPLDGIRVLDFTAFWAGPAATHLLATLGADVVKIESPTRPDGMRFATTRPPTDPEWVEYSPTFHGTNPGKRSVAIDFSTPSGRELVLGLVEHADVVVENFTPRVMPNVGLDYDELVARRPDLVMLRMPAFGLDGPWRDHSGFAQTTEQVSGIAWLTGTKDIEPLVRSTVDPIAGIHGALAVVAALAHGRRSGVGQLVELPMVEVALNVAAEPIVTWSAYGTLLERDGDRGPQGVPQGVYACRGDEQWLALSIRTDEQWRALGAVLGNPAWAVDPDLATRAGRRARHDAIDRELTAWFASGDRDEMVARLLAGGIHAAPVWDQNVQDQLPQLVASGFMQSVDHPVAGRVDLPGTGLRSEQFDLSYREPAPTVGQHTGPVLRDLLGLGDTELDALVALGAIGPVATSR